MAAPSILPGANAFTLPADAGSRPAVLLLHGFTGFPGDMTYLAEELNAAGFSVSVPRLPGHGTNGADFARTTWRDWLRGAEEALLAVRHEYGENVVVGGLSMGGLITTILAARYPVQRIALFAPAFDTCNPLVRFTPLLQWIIPPIPVSEPEQYDDPLRQRIATEYWNWMWPRQTASLRHLMVMARRALPNVTAPALTIVSEADMTVPATVSHRVSRRIGSAAASRVVTLQESGHVVTTGVDREQVAAETIAWFSQ